MRTIPSVPRQVFLFSGHMIDKLDRRPSRFPPECEPKVGAEISTKLAELEAGPLDLGITQGACGSDLLFAEALLEWGASLELCLPVPEEKFIRESVDFTKDQSFGADHWRDRFLAVRHHRSVRMTVMPESPQTERSESVYERCNLWMLERALSFGADKLRFICVWNGEGGDGPGGTQHMRNVVRESGASEYWIDLRKLC